MNWKNQNVFKWFVVHYPKDFNVIQNLKTDIDFDDIYNRIRLKFESIEDIIFKENSYSKEELADLEERIFTGMKENGYPVKFLIQENKTNKTIQELENKIKKT